MWTLTQIQGSHHKVFLFQHKLVHVVYFRLRIKFYDNDNQRFEVPLEIKGTSPTPPENPLYEIQFFNDPSFYFKVRVDAIR